MRHLALPVLSFVALARIAGPVEASTASGRRVRSIENSRVADGGSAIDPTIVSALISKLRKRDPLDRLTPREREVLTLMAEGRSNQGIADRFVITLRAVEKYV